MSRTVSTHDLAACFQQLALVRETAVEPAPAPQMLFQDRDPKSRPPGRLPSPCVQTVSACVCTGVALPSGRPVDIHHVPAWGATRALWRAQRPGPQLQPRSFQGTQADTASSLEIAHPFLRESSPGAPGWLSH